MMGNRLEFPAAAGARALQRRVWRGGCVWALLSLLGGLGGGVAQAQGGADEVLAQDDFRHGLDQWRIERESPDSRISAQNGVLEWWTPAGLTLWYRQPLGGRYEIRLTAWPVNTSFPGLPDRVSDLNLFWNAHTATGGDPGTRAASGALKAYDDLQLYYLGFGANGNRSTRLRRYDGSPARPQLAGYAEPEQATADDRLGPPPAFAKLHEGQAVQLRVQSLPTDQGAMQLKVWADGQLVFSCTDPQPYRQGWLALRSTASHFRISDFRVVRL